MSRHLSVTLVIPARNEESGLLALLPNFLGDNAVDTPFDLSVTVVSDHSTDRTVEVAKSFGAYVVEVPEFMPCGKGEALHFGLHRSYNADIYVTCDADLTDFTLDHIVRLVEPLVRDEDTVMARASYSYQDESGEDASTHRVTRLMARPLLAIFFPELAALQSPLAGEVALRARFLKEISFLSGYAVDAGLLIDTYLSYGIDGIKQVDLGVKNHRHHGLDILSLQAREVAYAILYKANRISLAEIEKDREFPFELDPEYLN
jgi:glucosyl-3-phosphoglycerate synthase